MTQVNGSVPREAQSQIFETRTIPLGKATISERRSDDATASRVFIGSAIKFNERTEIGNALTWGWYEECDPGMLTRTLEEDDQRFLVDHESQKVVSRISSGDLRLQVTADELLVESDLDTRVSYINDLALNVEARRITGMSFGFQTVRDRWETVEVEVEVDGKKQTRSADLRTILEVRLFEVSAVTFPAYEQTEADVRAMRDSWSSRMPRRKNVDSRNDPALSPAEADASLAADGLTRETGPVPSRAISNLDRRAQALAARYLLGKAQ